MLRLASENITEMKFKGYGFDDTGSKMVIFQKITVGRKLFVVKKKEFECLFALYSKYSKLFDVVRTCKSHQNLHTKIPLKIQSFIEIFTDTLS